MEVWGTIQNLVRSFVERIAAIIQQAPPGSIQITGILGLAAVVVGYYHLRGGNRRNTGSSNQQSGLPPRSDTNTSEPRPHHPQDVHQSPKPVTTDNHPSESLSAAAVAVRSQLSGAKRVTISSLGVLLSQHLPDDLSDGAVLQEGIAHLLLEIAKVTDLFIITQVADDVGEAVVMGILEAAGLVGAGVGQVKAHKILFCSTLEGKVSIVRQIEPDLHIDGSDDTIDTLKRFIPQLLHVSPHIRRSDAPNIGCVSSLLGYFSL